MSLKREQQMMMARCSPLTPFFDRRRLIDELFSEFTVNGRLEIKDDREEDDDDDHSAAASPKSAGTEANTKGGDDVLGTTTEKEAPAPAKILKKKNNLASEPLAIHNNKEKKQRTVKKAAKEASEKKKFEEGIFQLLTESWQLHGQFCDDLLKLTSRSRPSKKRRKQIFDALAKKGAIVWGRRRKNDNVIFELDDITSFEGFQAAWYLKLGTGVEKPDKPSI